MNTNEILTNQLILRYKKIAMEMLQYSFPTLLPHEISKAVDYSIIKRCKNNKAIIENNYKKMDVDSTLLEVADYILKREPIITSSGVMFKRHEEEDNPLAKLCRKFSDNRAINKKNMFKYPKGSEQYEKYNLFQLLDKLDGNSTYGVLGQCTSLFYNINVASSITSQGQSLISAAGLQFEMFLANGVKFSSINDVIVFINYIINEKSERKYNDHRLLDNAISYEDCFTKVIMTCGFDYIPTEKDMQIIWDIIIGLSQEDINRIYYKNNLYEFMENKSMNSALVYILKTLNKPFLDPNEAPEEIGVELNEFRDILMEYVYYHHQVIDKLDKYANMYRNVCIITDTDSTIISLDAWYRYASEKVNHLDLKIKQEVHSLFKEVKVDEFGDYDNIPLFTKIDTPSEYSFYSDEVIEQQKLINPFEVSSQEGLRYSIINVLAYCLGHIINDYMIRFTKNSNSYRGDKNCLIIMKNEFLFKRILLRTEAKKNYATLQEIQEGNIIPKDKQLDIKGMMMGKSGLPKSTQKALQKIMLEDILNSKDISQVKVLQNLGKMEKVIYYSIQNGGKEYFKPVRVKSMNSYENPMGQQGIKAVVVYNRVKHDYMEGIDLTEQNSIDVIKVNITLNNIEPLKESETLVYEGLLELLNEKYYAKGITTIAMPKNEILPDWLLNFIDYNTIISDNTSHMPIESLGIYRGRGSNNYTNILSI